MGERELPRGTRGPRSPTSRRVFAMPEREWGRPVCHQHGAWSRGEEDGAGNVEAAVTDDEDAAVRGPQALEPLACQEKSRRVAPPVAEEEVAARTIEHSGRVARVERYAAVVLVGPPDDELRRRLPERADDRREITLRAIRSYQAMAELDPRGDASAGRRGSGVDRASPVRCDDHGEGREGGQRVILKPRRARGEERQHPHRPSERERETPPEIG